MKGLFFIPSLINLIALQTILFLLRASEPDEFFKSLDIFDSDSLSTDYLQSRQNKKLRKRKIARKQQKKRKMKQKKRPNKQLTSDKVCQHALSMIKFLGTLHMKKLDLKYEPRLRRAAFIEWISQLEIAFSSNRYTKDVLKDYSTKNKITKVTSKMTDLLIYTVAYAFMDKVTRDSTSIYKNKRVKLLRALHIKCASIDSQTKQRAKYAFNNCRIGQEETAINFLTRLEQKANEARNYDIKISDKKFIWTLLNNMKHHKYYKERIASFLTNFELNPSCITQRWLENKFYSLDDEKMHISRQRYHKESARFTHQKGINNILKINKLDQKSDVNIVTEWAIMIQPVQIDYRRDLLLCLYG